MTKLFNDSEVFTKERPTKPTQQQLTTFYSQMAKEIIAEGYSSSDEEDIIADLINLDVRDNGFEMAKSLESFRAKASYDISVDFCEWLEWFSNEYRRLNEKNIEDWVKAHNIKPQLKKGQKLAITITLNFYNKAGKIIYITGINEQRAYYLIAEDHNRNGGTIIPYEKLEANCIKID